VTASEPMPDTVLVIGGSGRTGRLVLQRLLHGKTFELYADREASPPEWPAIFARLATDERQASS
jgi:hypothetical protein